MPPFESGVAAFNYGPDKEEAERVRAAIEKAKVECEFDSKSYEQGVVRSSKLDLSKFGSFPIPVINLLQRMASECADYVSKGTFSDNTMIMRNVARGAMNLRRETDSGQKWPTSLRKGIGLQAIRYRT